jgi:CDP-diacylglycerol--inositol 3-phosphatidyltransferase
MVTDRVSTCGLMVILSRFYPDATLLFVFLIVLDISSHWFHVMSVSAHHKSKEALENRNAILQWYYSVYPLFGYCCVGTELFYILLYVLNFYSHPSIEMVGQSPVPVLVQLVCRLYSLLIILCYVFPT